LKTIEGASAGPVTRSVKAWAAEADAASASPTASAALASRRALRRRRGVPYAACRPARGSDSNDDNEDDMKTTPV
jgi:hypothetical protein